MTKPMAAPHGEEKRQRENAKRASYWEKVRQARELSLELGVGVMVNEGTHTFRVMGGYTADTPEGVRRLVKRLIPVAP